MRNSRKLQMPFAFNQSGNELQRKSQQNFAMLIFIIIFMLLLLEVDNVILKDFHKTITQILHPGARTTNSIFVQQTKDGEIIGLSDGRSVFDIYPGRDTQAISFKQQAAQILHSDVSSAEALWHAALQVDMNDAETRIYLENQGVLDSGAPYFTLCVAVSLGKGNFAYSSREILQGAYVAQYEWNMQHVRGPKLRLLIANAGSNPTRATLVARQLVQDYDADPTLLAVAGWSSSEYTLDALQVLNTSHILMLSPMASADSLSGITPDFFRIVPINQTQAVQAANYAINGYSRVALFESPTDLYSQNLAQDFAKEFQKRGGKVVATEQYNTNNPQAFPMLLNDALRSRPGLVYFAGNSPDLGRFLAILPTSGPFSSLHVMSGDTAYVLASYPNQPISNMDRLLFTSAAHPQEWDWLHLVARKPPFFRDYFQLFSEGVERGNMYNATHPGAYTMLAYDALSVLQQALRSYQTFQGQRDLQDLLQQIKSSHVMRSLLEQLTPFQGVSGQITFDNRHDVVNKALVIVRADKQGFLHIESIEGCFLATGC